jgi:hypothetical protein
VWASLLKAAVSALRVVAPVEGHEWYLDDLERDSLALHRMVVPRWSLAGFI